MWLSTKASMKISEQRPVSVDKITFKKDIGLHWHEYFEIEFYIGGKGSTKINGTEYILQKGVICMFNTTDFHDIHFDRTDPLQEIRVTMDPNILDFDLLNRIFSIKGNACFQLDEENYNRIYNLMELCADQASKQGVFTNKCMQDIVEIIFIILLEFTETDSENMDMPATKSYIMRAISYLEMNFYKNPSLEEVANYVLLNKNYFCTLFRKQTGKTFIRYINDLKLQYAKKLLSSTDLAANEIFYKCGFGSFSTFLHEFRAKYGETPMQYRRRKK